MKFLPALRIKYSVVIIALTVAIALAGTSQPQAEAQVTPQALHKAYIPNVFKNYSPPYNNPFGIVMYDAIDQGYGLAQMQAAGAAQVTTELAWASIEPAEGIRNWSGFDTKVQNARAAGMSVYVLFTGDPSWAWNASHTATIPEKRLNFVRDMVERYDCDGVNDAGPNLCVKDWSFYPEPDYSRSYLQTTPGAKGYWGHRGKEYAQMLAYVANEVHRQDSTARVLIGGIAYDSFEPQGGFVRSFLPDVLAELNTVYGGATYYIDAIAVHYYSLSFPSIRDKIREIRTIMQTYGVENLPIVVPESGHWSDPAANSSEQIQAQRLVQIYVEALSVGVQNLSWFNVFDSGPGTESSGLFRGRDLNSPKLAYFAYQTLTRELAQATYLRPFNQMGITGYTFATPAQGEKTVVWTANPTSRASFTGACVRVTSVTGSVVSIADGAGGDQDRVRNGVIGLNVLAHQPLYVGTCR